MWNWPGPHTELTELAASSVSCIAAGPRSALRKHMKWHLSDRGLGQNRPSTQPSVHVSCCLPCPFVFYLRVMFMLYHVVSYENMFMKSYQGFYYILTVSVVNVTGTRPWCCYLHLIYENVPWCYCVISSQNIMHWLIYCSFTVNLKRKETKFTFFHLFCLHFFIYICNTDYVAIFYFCVLISM